MKKGISSLLILCALFGFTQQKETQPKFNGWTSHNLQGRVKELRLTTYPADTKGRKLSEQAEGHKHQFAFSEQGDELQYNIYDASGKLLVKSVPSYINGRIGNTTNTDMATGQEEQWVMFSYLLDFYPQEAHCYVNNNLQKKLYNQVNAMGHLTHTRVMDNNDRPTYLRGMKYDAQENLVAASDTFKVLNNKDSIVQTTYRYLQSDSNHNWTLRLDHINGRTMITEREIVYYK
ncbi:hypothetical protein D3C72_918320 [compost metagenome]